MAALSKAIGGFEGLLDAPWYLVDMLNSALGVVSMFEQPDEYRPPQNIMHHDERLKSFYEKLKRDLKSGNKTTSNDIVHDERFDNSEAMEYLRANGLT